MFAQALDMAQEAELYRRPPKPAKIYCQMVVVQQQRALDAVRFAVNALFSRAYVVFFPRFGIGVVHGSGAPVFFLSTLARDPQAGANARKT